MATKKRYTIDAWRKASNGSGWSRLQLGTLHYTSSKKKPAAFGYEVSSFFLSNKACRAYASGGWDNIADVKFDVEAYHGLIQAFLDAAPTDAFIHVYVLALYEFCGRAVQRGVGADIPTGSIFTLNRDLEAKKVARAHELEYTSLLWDELTANADIFDNAVLAARGMDSGQRMAFLRGFTRYMQRGIGYTSNQDVLLRDCFTRLVIEMYPATANLAAASILVDSLDFKEEDDGARILYTLDQTFGPKAEVLDTLELPANLAP